jgi:hypothetical protein
MKKSKKGNPIGIPFFALSKSQVNYRTISLLTFSELFPDTRTM